MHNGGDDEQPTEDTGADHRSREEQRAESAEPKKAEVLQPDVRELLRPPFVETKETVAAYDDSWPVELLRAQLGVDVPHTDQAPDAAPTHQRKGTGTSCTRRARRGGPWR